MPADSGCIPGRIAPAQSESCSVSQPRSRAADVPAPTLTDVERRIWDFLAEQPRTVDLIARHLEKAVHELTGTLMKLEMKKVVRRLPGNVYERV